MNGVIDYFEVEAALTCAALTALTALTALAALTSVTSVLSDSL